MPVRFLYLQATTLFFREVLRGQSGSQRKRHHEFCLRLLRILPEEQWGLIPGLVGGGGVSPRFALLWSAVY